MPVDFEEVLRFAQLSCDVYSSPDAIVALLGDCFTVTKKNGTIEIAIKGTDTLSQGALNVVTTVFQTVSWFYSKVETHAHVTGLMETADHLQYLNIAHLIIKEVDKMHPSILGNENCEKYIICGHSRGGTIAMYCGLLLLQKGRQVTQIYTYGAPKLFLNNDVIKTTTEDTIKLWKEQMLHIEHQFDPVPKVSGVTRTALGSKEVQLVEGHVIKLSNAAPDYHSMVLSYLPGLEEIV